jgi:hypothetical protein
MSVSIKALPGAPPPCRFCNGEWHLCIRDGASTGYSHNCLWDSLVEINLEHVPVDEKSEKLIRDRRMFTLPKKPTVKKKRVRR